MELVLEVLKLLLKLSEISLPVLQFCNFVLKLRHEEILMLRYFFDLHDLLIVRWWLNPLWNSISSINLSVTLLTHGQMLGGIRGIGGS